MVKRWVYAGGGQFETISQLLKTWENYNIAAGLMHYNLPYLIGRITNSKL